jgi:hypothetical protein
LATFFAAAFLRAGAFFAATFLAGAFFFAAMGISLSVSYCLLVWIKNRFERGARREFHLT